MEDEDSYPTVAIVVDRETGIYFDRCFTWESGQSYAAIGWRVIAIRDDGHRDVASAQAMYDYELEIYKDFNGIA